ncbi:M3 family oligoendopeptidase [Blautia segnis]|uniref:M3 family oligoendopeptidase n=1 Tax=Blautia segnis TaxID=2763030 RepID=A0A8I0DPV6_9FIRM|nr:M3 family oligoendopeptidase [Blautia segnis]MBC5649836.1 M3 family oligoendopeptidase [Blautia segnis]
MKFSEMPYNRVDFPAVIAQGKEIIQRASQAKSGEEQFEIHQEFYKLLDHVNTLYTIAHIRRDGNVADAFYEEENAYYDEMLPELTALGNEYQKVLFATPYRAYMEEKIGPVAFKSMELEMKCFNDSLIPLMQEENTLSTRYRKLIASAKIMWEGEELNLSLMSKYMRSSDRDTRKKAWAAYAGFFEDNQEELDEIYDQLVKNRTKQAQMLGFENFIDMGYCRMNRNSYTKEDIQKLRDQIKKVFVPLASKMHKNRQARLGVEQLHYYDIGVYFPQGDPAPIGTPEEILESGRKMYTEMSAETKDFFNMMMENELFDVFGRKNKATGGYMTELPDYGVPFIFANFNGTSGDVDVITHECGHAFQSYVAGKDPIKDHYRYLTMETAEIHSMSMEFFAEPWIELFFGERGEDYRKMHLEDAIDFIPYGTMVDEFQHIVYGNPEMTPKERRDAWKQLEKEYRPFLDVTGCKFLEDGRYWQRQHHIYELPFYYIDYVLAQLCAFQFKIRMEKDQADTWAAYMKLCELSASDFYPSMLKQVGLTVPFEEGCIQKIVAGLDKKLVQ